MVLPSHNINTDFYNSALKVPSRLHDRNDFTVDLSGRFDATTDRVIFDKSATNVGLAVNDLVVVINTGQFGVVISTAGTDPTIRVGNFQADIPVASLGSLNTKLSLL